MDDFCIEHGYEFMKSRFGDPITYCSRCEMQLSQAEIEVATVAVGEAVSNGDNATEIALAALMAAGATRKR
jgi:hypothetical protein